MELLCFSYFKTVCIVFRNIQVTWFYVSYISIRHDKFIWILYNTFNLGLIFFGNKLLNRIEQFSAWQRFIKYWHILKVCFVIKILILMVQGWQEVRVYTIPAYPSFYFILIFLTLLTFRHILPNSKKNNASRICRHKFYSKTVLDKVTWLRFSDFLKKLIVLKDVIHFVIKYCKFKFKYHVSMWQNSDKLRTT